MHADMPSSQPSEMEVDQYLSTSHSSFASHEHDDDNDTIMDEIACPPTWTYFSAIFRNPIRTIVEPRVDELN